MKATTELQLGLSTSLTPQMQQSLKLLQMSALELETLVQDTLDSNPLLEINQDIQFQQDEMAPQSTESSPSSEQELPEHAVENMPEELPLDIDWETYYPNASPYEDSELPSYQPVVQESLTEHLQAQIKLSQLSIRDQEIAFLLIDALDERGWLPQDNQELLEACKTAISVEITGDEVSCIIHYLRSLNPIGIGARNLEDCLLIQLEALSPRPPEFKLTRSIIRRYLSAVAENNLSVIYKKLRCTEGDILRSIDLIRSFSPCPGAPWVDVAPLMVSPDVIVRKTNYGWIAQLAPNLAHNLTVSKRYNSLYQKGSSTPESRYVKDKMQEAKWLVRSLRHRNETLLSVAKEIVSKQQAFMAEGELAMKPLKLSDIAESVNLHESTVSRAVRGKYLLTPHGLMELKQFFSNQVGENLDGNSAFSIRAMIKQLVLEENKQKPLSDSKITELLAAKGVQVARRTVAKYREAMNIPTSSDRRLKRRR